MIFRTVRGCPRGSQGALKFSDFFVVFTHIDTWCGEEPEHPAHNSVQQWLFFSGVWTALGVPWRWRHGGPFPRCEVREQLHAVTWQDSTPPVLCTLSSIIGLLCFDHLWEGCFNGFDQSQEGPRHLLA